MTASDASSMHSSPLNHVEPVWGCPRCAGQSSPTAGMSKGSQFSAAVPSSRSPRPSQHRTLLMKEKILVKKKILIVDAEPLIRWSLAKTLQGWGYETVEAATIATAREAVDPEDPAPVLLHITLLAASRHALLHVPN